MTREPCATDTGLRPPLRGFGLPRALRLRRSEDFARLNEAGRRLSTRSLSCRWARNELPSPRFGLAVSRRVGNAVVRNRVKRWLRDAIRHQRGDLTGVDVVLIARPVAAEAGYHALRGEVGEVFDRIRRAA